MVQRSYRCWLIGLAVLVFFADQASKYAVFAWQYHDGAGGEYDVIPGAFKLIAQFDPNAAPCDCVFAT